MHFIIISIFPEMFLSFTKYGIISKALNEKQIKISTINPRIFAKKKYHKIDDKPFGGGTGMIMMYEPLEKSILQAKGMLNKALSKTIYLSPQGTCLTQKKIKTLCQIKNMILICGRYKGIDQRIIDKYVEEEISIGDYVLSGGEIPAMVIIESITRLIPNAINNIKSATSDSFYEELLDHPHYTRPAILKNNKNVPSILLSGMHKKIQEWQHNERLKKTFKKRNDLIRWDKLSAKDKKFINQLKNIEENKDEQ